MARKYITDEQEQFCRLIVEGYTNTEAYINVYKPNAKMNSIYISSSRMRNHPNIKARILELRNLGAIDSVVVKDRIVAAMLEALDKATGDICYDEFELYEEYDIDGNPTSDWKERRIKKQKVNIADVAKISDSLAKMYGLYEKQEVNTGVVINISGELDD